MLKKLPIMLNIMFMTTAIMPQAHSSYTILLFLMITLELLGSILLCFILWYVTVFLSLVFHAQCYAHEKSCAAFYTMLA